MTRRAYSPGERFADAAIHALGVSGSAIAVSALWLDAAQTGDAMIIVAAGLYGAGLIAMLWFSAAYNLTSRPDRKEVLRRCDHAAIFLMIAGTYTPFALVAISGAVGGVLLMVVWVTAIGGMLFKLLSPRRLEGKSVVLYLALGWAGLPAAGFLIAALPTTTLVLLGVGGLLYTAGVAVHLWSRLPGQNAVWHGFVLAAAACHYVAVTEVLGI